MRQKNCGVTLIELLVVVAIIALLVQLILPAIQASREAARNTACQNNLRQMGVACQSHLSSTGRFPTGGWGHAWAGDPDRGTDKRQPGGWIYNILPHLEQQQLYRLGAGSSSHEKKVGATQMCQTPLPLFNCPSKRRSKAYPYWRFSEVPMWNTNHLEVAAKSDYAASAGDYFSHGVPGPETLALGDSPDYQWDDPDDPQLQSSLSTGVIFQRSEIGAEHVMDGLTHTYLAGEKFMPPQRYKTGEDGGDDQTMYGGCDADINRWTLDPKGKKLLPLRDTEKSHEGRYRFGSPHPIACNFLYCDGSVRSVNYDVDENVHRFAGTRADEGAQE